MAVLLGHQVYCKPATCVCGLFVSTVHCRSSLGNYAFATQLDTSLFTDY